MHIIVLVYTEKKKKNQKSQVHMVKVSQAFSISDSISDVVNTFKYWLSKFY